MLLRRVHNNVCWYFCWYPAETEKKSYRRQWFGYFFDSDNRTAG